MKESKHEFYVAMAEISILPFVKLKYQNFPSETTNSHHSNRSNPFLLLSMLQQLKLPYKLVRDILHSISSFSFERRRSETVMMSEKVKALPKTRRNLSSRAGDLTRVSEQTKESQQLSSLTLHFKLTCYIISHSKRGLCWLQPQSWTSKPPSKPQPVEIMTRVWGLETREFLAYGWASRFFRSCLLTHHGTPTKKKTSI